MKDVSQEAALDRRTRLLIALFVFCAACLLYLPRTALSPQESDGAELATAALTGAILHPPGYPLYAFLSSLLVKSFSLPAYATLSLFSAVCQACAGVAVFLACFALSNLPLCSLAISFAWICYEPTVRTATDTELFAFHNLLITLFLLYLIAFHKKKKHLSSEFFFFGLLGGLCMAHHHISILWLALACSIWIAGLKLSQQVSRHALLSILGFCVGLLPYLSLLHIFHQGPPLAFSAPGSFYELLRYVMREDYGTLSLIAGQTGTQVSYFWHFLGITCGQLPLLTLGSALLFWILLRERSVLTLGLALTLLLHLLFACRLMLPPNLEIHGEWIQRFYASIALCLCFCCTPVVRRIVKNSTGDLFLALVVALSSAWLTLPEALYSGDARDDITTHVELEQIWLQVPDGAIFLASLDRIAMGMHYYQAAYHPEKSIHTVVIGQLRNIDYRHRLKHTLNFLSDIPADQLTLQSIVREALKRGVPVFAYNEFPAPPGLYAAPLGTVSQWLPIQYPVPISEVIHRLYQHCSRLPEALFTFNPYRHHSDLIRRIVFLSPLTAYISGDTLFGAALKRAGHLFSTGNAARAHRICSRGLKQFFGSARTHPSPYQLNALPPASPPEKKLAAPAPEQSGSAEATSIDST